jgi:hypothetical protein
LAGKTTGARGAATSLPSRSDPRLVTAVETEIAERSPVAQGTEIVFLCPSHKDRNPSARWNTEKKVWYCDVCGHGGGVIDLARKLGVKRS